MAKPHEATYAITVMRPPLEVYAFWRDLRNIPRVSRHVRDVEELGDGLSRWTVEGPNGDLHWTARTVEDIPGDTIGWETADQADVPSQGRVEFRPAPGERGTEVYVHLDYDSPGGFLGEAWARMKGDHPEQAMKETLRRMKAILECGEIPVVEGQPSDLMRGDPRSPAESRKVGVR